MKICKHCDTEKPWTEYYTSNKNTCKSCLCARSRDRYKRKSKDPEWVEAERTRGREKYHRLEYKNLEVPKDVARNRTKNYRTSFPEKYKAKIASQRIPCPPNHHRHHWSYNEEHHKDIIILSSDDHYKIHMYMTYDENYRMYRDCDGELLDTKKSHTNFINDIIRNPEWSTVY